MNVMHPRYQPGIYVSPFDYYTAPKLQIHLFLVILMAFLYHSYMYELVSIGDITMDMYFQGDSLTQENGRFSLAIGGKYYTNVFHSGIGGSGGNVAIHASNLGVDSAVVATIGETTFKNVIVQTLIKKSVSTEFLNFDRDHTSISTILLSPQGEKTVIKYSDPKEHIVVSSHALDRIKAARIIFMGNLADVSVTEREKFLKAVKTDTNIIALNFGAKDCERDNSLLAPLLAHANILFLNKYEFCELIKKDPKKVDLLHNHFKEIKGAQEIVVVTSGADGSYVYTENEVKHQPAVNVDKIVDTTGAGDSFTAAFLVKYSESKSIDEALTAAATYSAKQLSDIGAN